ncbi:helix-turn-helix transcriptional regulator [Actinomadura gamaensis]|uniref:Helix-turn-helix transcriptional regulator n=1 Tax=Actinomadura gamaensis TaxID=1763541 RepID=A0ABV9U3W7_9ACTN
MKKPSTDRMLTVDEFCDNLRITQRTFYEWRAKGTAPRCIKIPNGQLRIRPADYERWLDSRQEVAA